MFKKIISIFFALIMCTAISAVSVSADWEETDEGVKYTDSTGKYVTGWKKIDGKKYYFDTDGLMKTGWLELQNGTKYYFSKDGSMKTGWLTMKSGKKYYFDKDGKMYANKWLKTKKGNYYFEKDGQMATGMVVIGDKLCRFDKKGIFRTEYYYIKADVDTHTDKIEISDFYIYSDTEITGINRYKIYFSGKVTNKSKQTFKQVSVEFDIYDEDGYLVIDDKFLFLIKDFKPGQTISFSDDTYTDIEYAIPYEMKIEKTTLSPKTGRREQYN